MTVQTLARRFGHALTLALLPLVLVAPARGEDARAREILERVANQPVPRTSAVKLRMILIARRGGKEYTKEREVVTFAKRGDDYAYTVLRFTKPKDVAGVALLVRQRKGSESEQYLYMPALKQDPKRISGGQRNQSFLGTDFTFADLEGRDPEAWEHTYLGEEELDGHKVWKIASTPKPGTDAPYTKVVQWIRQDLLVPVKVEFYDRHGLRKVLTVERVERVGDYMIATRTRMEDLRRKHATVLEILDQKLDIEIPDHVFTTRGLKTGG